MKEELFNSINRIFSVELREKLNNILRGEHHIEEIRLRVGQPLVVRTSYNEIFISYDGNRTDNYDDAYIVEDRDISETLEYVSNYSLYAFEEEIKQGYITVMGGHRIGLCGRVLINNGEIKTIKNISFINIRIAHELKGCSNDIIDKLYKDKNRIYNTLIISPPKAGKTTLLRDIIRNISNGNKCFKGLNVGVADERSEIAACYMGRPQNEVGIRTDVMDGVPKALGIMMMIRTMSPDVIAVDEIGLKDDVHAILEGINCGCSFIGTIHGTSIEDIRKRPEVEVLIDSGIFEKYIIIMRNNGKILYELI
jgi:stage III sporulation protein AA